MKITGIEHLTVDDVNHEVARGGRFVYYEFCVSIIVASRKGHSSIYFIKGGHSPFMKGLPFTLLTFLLGWWFIWRGPVWTIAALSTNLRGGNDVTETVLTSINETAASRKANPHPSHPADRPRQTL